jgi:hypothetical protein
MGDRRLCLERRSQDGPSPSAAGPRVPENGWQRQPRPAKSPSLRPYHHNPPCPRPARSCSVGGMNGGQGNRLSARAALALASVGRRELVVGVFMMVAIAAALTVPVASADPTYQAMNASGGIYWRSAPDWNTPVAVSGNGVYDGTTIAVHCYQSGTAVPGSNDTMWEQATVVAGPGHGSGWLNEHFINDGSAINQPSPGVPPCNAPAPPPAPSPPPSSGGGGLVFTVFNAEGGIYYRSSPHWADTPKISGVGVYNGDQVELICGAFGDPIGPYNDTAWSYVRNLSRSVGDGWVNEHYINDGAVADQFVAGEPTCDAGIPGASGSSGAPPAPPASSPAKRRFTDPCGALSGFSRRLGGGRLVYDRQASVRMVCQGFGTDTGGLHVDWLTPGMKCAVIAAGIGARYEAAGIFVDGACSVAEIRAHPGVVSAVGGACSTASDLLGLTLKAVGVISGLACAAAPSVGRGLGTWLESHHEYAVAKDVMRKRECLEYRSYLGWTSWHAVSCR